ncbi:MAG: septal ring lytic transglycosylase RlpA family lipoprotein [Gammaproteobacteria bacterium]|nr:MAG: septal ring lytic transglycosylase RlpA family lipoprotein [Gammaproteobacteria bacterium]RLA52926.1 MAG: septal ring lytic transglycosylase RlpA family lipoprotein [Gammaproteobacteria bacterium]
MPNLKSILLLSLALLLIACTSTDSKEASSQRAGSLPSVIRDGPPPDDVDVSTIADAVPRIDPVTAAGNKNPYSINGKTYRLLPVSAGYREVGMASWYGTKFHGNPTSNGETYSMYGMTAAHKTLPIPAYARVTNLANNRSVIVRINDRGPFHSDRIIDLSYAAAKKLGYAAHGTARVEVTVIDPVAFQQNSVALPRESVAAGSTLKGPYQQTTDTASTKAFLQVGAYTTYTAAKQHRQQVSGITAYPVAVHEAVHPTENSALFKVVIGPITNRIKLFQLRDQLIQQGPFSPFVVYNTSGTGLP